MLSTSIYSQFTYSLGFLAACTAIHLGNINTASHAIRVSENYYFDFDQITHYQIEIDEDTLWQKKDNNGPISEEDQLLFDLIHASKPGSLTDTSFISKLVDIGFKKYEIDSGDYAEINEIFKDKTVSEILETFCPPVYRDLLIFRKNHRIIGMAKICFTCSKSKIYGSKANTVSFGQDGDFLKLERILHSK